MSYCKDVEKSIDGLIESWPDIEKKSMFGGLCYLDRGNMCFGIWQDYLIVRTGPEVARRRLGEPSVKPFEVTGKQMKGWLMVGPEALEEGTQLQDWLELGRSCTETLPAK